MRKEKTTSSAAMNYMACHIRLFKKWHDAEIHHQVYHGQLLRVHQVQPQVITAVCSQSEPYTTACGYSGMPAHGAAVYDHGMGGFTDLMHGCVSKSATMEPITPEISAEHQGNLAPSADLKCSVLPPSTGHLLQDGTSWSLSQLGTGDFVPPSSTSFPRPRRRAPPKPLATTNLPVENFACSPQTEITHERISKLATMGGITPEIIGTLPGYLAPSAGTQSADIPYNPAAISTVPASIDYSVDSHRQKIELRYHEELKQHQEHVTALHRDCQDAAALHYGTAHPLRFAIGGDSDSDAELPPDSRILRAAHAEEAAEMPYFRRAVNTTLRYPQQAPLP
jgi:hypothetical protein